MRDIEDGEEEIKKSENYNIRFMMIKNVAMKGKGTDDYSDVEIEIPWSTSDQFHKLKMMSALCYLFARNIQDFMLKEGLTPPPIGLISTEWGGTPIESWSPDSAINKCKSREKSTEMDKMMDQKISGSLWNTMVNPLKWNSVKGFLWYQGEANRGRNRDLYQCTFPALIQSWREEFSSHSSTDPMAPFGFVQLTQNQAGKPDHDWTVIRWHQTADVGFVPNEKMPNTFMGVAPDTYGPKINEFSGGIHPMDKQTPSLRLAIAGFNIAYGFTNYPTRGPWPLSVETDGEKQSVVIIYDQPIKFNVNSSTSGFHVCFKNEFICDDTGKNVNWKKIDKSQVSFLNAKSVSILIPFQEEKQILTIGYLWEVTPVLERHNLPIYAMNEFKLPSPPWKREIKF